METVRRTEGTDAGVGGAMTVLMIEDDPDYAEIVKEIFARTQTGSFHVIWADNLSEGIHRLLNLRRLDLVLLDLHLPDSDFDLTLSKIRDLASRAPVVILSGMVDESIRSRVMTAGASDFLLKGDLAGPLLLRSVSRAIEQFALVRRK